jgi:glutathione S-transferase
MNRLTQFRLCPHSRSVRLALSELGTAVELLEERAWEYRPQFLALNPAGELPVLQLENGATLMGAYAIAEYLAEAVGPHRTEPRGMTLFPGGLEDRAEIRRLVDWFHGKLDREVTRELATEKVVSRFSTTAPPPNPDVLRAVRANLRYHLSYIGHLANQRRWLAGDEPSFADLAGAAHLSVIDYLGEVAWDDYPGARAWYARVKSRPSFRPLLADRVPGVPVAPHYADLDF